MRDGLRQDARAAAAPDLSTSAMTCPLVSLARVGSDNNSASVLNLQQWFVEMSSIFNFLLLVLKFCMCNLNLTHLIVSNYLDFQIR